ncbi:aldo/keto reductase [Mycobacteroides chelonae]|jgi:aryl-alcohol dehydrogenase-like predicted oxidoreductase|uniref:Aldo/keto reductase n=1 Tax=Mycobacteroides chelonae TaxID=1774 RepID=A0AB73MA95_MYCCH|nr:aldo/keto reductase [Mycobacteroides chelonae]MBF9329801.1 aldo/keto reductase [Mycobacteroides chelonae]MBF9423732.1 aldo/keto reductase [Mycobacteroides chelonae]MBF9437335.1 aldo/keto reductase [Mycobacteroides chelonae]MBV6358633.1 aldo/keto reductase [Mycobacteroides chelonae]MEC4835734.1 aldo/keto reductase [Mycobacteroides chelonae]
MMTKTIGTLTTSALGLGCMAMSGAYGVSDRDEATATVHAALDAGITLLDTADFYGMGHNELLIAEALRSVPRDQYQLSVKFGAQLGPDTSWAGFDARPCAVKAAVAYSLQRLGTDHIDIYRPARLDPAVPIEDTIGAIGELVDAGYVRRIGLSEVGSETIRRAAAVRPINDLQIEYSLVSRGVENNILNTCRELGIGVTAYGVLARGLISGHWTKSIGGQGDFRKASPRFAEDNLDRNLALVEALRSVAQELDVTVAQAAIAWVGSRGADIVPLVGARTRTRLAEALGAATLELTVDQLDRIEVAVPAAQVAGDRYPAAQMAVLDSER